MVLTQPPVDMLNDPVPDFLSLKLLLLLQKPFDFSKFYFIKCFRRQNFSWSNQFGIVKVTTLKRRNPVDHVKNYFLVEVVYLEM